MAPICFSAAPFRIKKTLAMSCAAAHLSSRTANVEPDVSSEEISIFQAL